MKFLIVCAGDKLDNHVSLKILTYLINNYSKKHFFFVCVVDDNKQIIKFLKSKKIKFINKKINNFLENIEPNHFDWLLNIWGPIIYSKEILAKFNRNLNLHPSYLPYARGKDPYVWAVQNEYPVGITIHEMNQKIDNGKYFVRKRLNLNFPYTGGDVFELTLKSVVDEFVKNWPKILNNRISGKKFVLNNSKIFKRKDLIKDNLMDLDNKINIKTRKFILKALSQDFKFNKLQVKIKNKIYDLKLHLKKTNKKKWN